MARTVFSCLAAVLCGCLLWVMPAAADPAEYAGSSASGEEVFFTTAEKMVPGDTDNGFVDVYERFYNAVKETYVTREISTGPTGGNDSYDVSFDAVSGDGKKVFFSTAESLTEDDGDRARDVYERKITTGETLLVSGGPGSCAPCGDREIPVTFAGSTDSGSKIYFTTAEKLVAADGDEAGDVYVRDLTESAAKLASPGGSSPAAFDGASADGNRIAFETTDKLDGSDGDTETDVYERDLAAGTTKLVSGGTCPSPLPQTECVPAYRAITGDGSVFLQTKAQMTAEDEDVYQDVYRWAASTGDASLISTSTEGEEGEGDHNAIYAGIAADGDVAFFETDESLAGGDNDETSDVYQRTAGATSLVSPGSQQVDAVFSGASADGATVLFSTREPLGGGDSGGKLDVYARSGLTTTLLTPGSTAFDATFVGSSADASDVFYLTSQKVVAADSDEKADIYEVSDGDSPIFVSFGPAGGNGAFTAHLADVSADGNHAFLTTRERLTVDDDFSTETDVYDHSSTAILLVSVGNSGEIQLGPPIPALTATDPGSPNVSLEPRIIGEAEPGTSIKIYPTVDCSGAPAAVGSAAELLGAGIPVEVKADSTTVFHATATNASGDTSDCSVGAVSYTQQNVTAPPEEETSGGPDGGSGGDGGGSGSTTGSGTGTTSGGTSGSGSGTTPAAIRIGGVVYVEPATRVTFGPLAKTRSRNPVFRFLDTTEQPNTTFLCRVDRKAWKGCGSPYKIKGLKLGKHVFAVKGRSFAGQWEQQPVVRRFKVVAP
jgi:hypothetical protein